MDFAMPKKHPQPAGRRPRSDAQQNRDRILEVAKAAFTRSGADASLDDIAKKQIIASALNSVVGGPSRLYDSSRVQVTGAIDALVKTAMKSGEIRKDLEPFDLLRALIGVSNVATGPDWQESARRLVDILIKGSRPMK